MNLGRKNKLSKLLEETPEKYYWLGFLMADGHFSKQNRLSLNLALLDKDHVFKFQNYINCGNVQVDYQAHIKVMDVSTLSYLKEKYKIHNNKTENPPDLSQIIGDNLFSFMIGFIDGDGSIQYQTGRTDVKLAVKCHRAWKEALSYIFKFPARINNQGYSYLGIADNTILREFKRKAIELNLPILTRKWDKIDLNKESKYLKSDIWQEKAFNLYDNGITQIQKIADILDKKYITVYQAIKRRNYERQSKRKGGWSGVFYV